MKNLRHSAWLPWASIGLLAILCGVLAVLQYRWIGEIAGAERTRLRDALQAHLNNLSRALNDELTAAANALVPGMNAVDEQGREAAFSTQYLRSRDNHERFFRRIGIAVPNADEDVQLLLLDFNTARYVPAAWPAEWNGMRDRLLRHGHGGPPMTVAGSTLFELPRFARRDDRPSPEADWLIVEIDTEYVTGTVIPELLNRHLGESGRLEYDAQIVDNFNPSTVVYRSPGGPGDISEGRDDASVALLDIRFSGFGERGGRGPGRGFGRGPGPRLEMRPGPGRGGPPDFNQGRWRLLVRHHAGSLETMVARARWRNLGISAAILLLIIATVVTCCAFPASAQLAELQMNFVAGVSHELRTPLTVIRTAAFNLRGTPGGRPEQVERYGKLIQEESEKLAATWSRSCSSPAPRPAT